MRLRIFWLWCIPLFVTTTWDIMKESKEENIQKYPFESDEDRKKREQIARLQEQIKKNQEALKSMV